MYKNNFISDEERQQILEQHKSYGYGKTLTERQQLNEFGFKDFVHAALHPIETGQKLAAKVPPEVKQAVQNTIQTANNVASSTANHILNPVGAIATDYATLDAAAKKKGFGGIGDFYKQSLLHPFDTIKKAVGDPSLTAAAETTTNKDTQAAATTNTATTGTAKVAPTIPTGLKDSEGVKKFQDWLDANASDAKLGAGKGWATGFKDGVLNKQGGYGRFGPRTARAWKTYGATYGNGNTAPASTTTPITPAVTPAATDTTPPSGGDYQYGEPTYA